MSRWILAVGAVVVLTAGVVLYIAMRDSGGAKASPSPSTSAPPPSSEPATPRASGDRPPRPPEAQGDGSGESPREYVVGNVRVRDHRTGNHAPTDLPPNIHPPDQKKVPSTLTHELSQQILPIMRECAKALAPESRGDKPRLEGTIFIAVKDHQARITEATMKLREIAEGAAPPVQQCIEEKSIGLTAGAADVDDIDRYSISLTFAVP